MTSPATKVFTGVNVTPEPWAWSMCIHQGDVVLFDVGQGHLVRVQLPVSPDQAGTVSTMASPITIDDPVDVCTDAEGRLVVAEQLEPRIIRLSSTSFQRLWPSQDCSGFSGVTCGKTGEVFAIAIPRWGLGGKIVKFSPEGTLDSTWGKRILGRMCSDSDGNIYVLNMAYFKLSNRRQFLLSFCADSRRRFIRRLVSDSQVTSISMAPDGGVLLLSAGGRWLYWVDADGRRAKPLLAWGKDVGGPVAVAADEKEVLYVLFQDGTLEVHNYRAVMRQR